MSFNINQFRSAMALDGARPNLFECRMNFPEIVRAGANRANADGLGISQQFTFFCRAAQLPGSTVNAIPVPYFGRELKFAGNRTFTEWTVTIINDEDFKIRNAMELWMNGLNSHRGNLRSPAFAGPRDYQKNGHVIQYGKSGEALKSYSFIGMFPIDVTPIELDWGANDTIEEYAVTFAYQWWESTVGDSNGTGLSPPTRNVAIV